MVITVGRVLNGRPGMARFYCQNSVVISRYSNCHIQIVIVVFTVKIQ